MCRMCDWSSFCRSVGFPMVMGFTHTVVYGVSYITSEDLQKEMETEFDGKEGVQPRLVILDARRTDEFFMSHIENATNIHSTLLRGKKMADEMMAKLEGVDKDAHIVLYCAVGLRSSWLGKYLMRLGYTNVQVLYHGYYNWANEGRPIYTRYPPNQILKRHEEHEFQRSQPPDIGLHVCKGLCYPTYRVLPQHWVAAQVLDSKLTTKLPYPSRLYGSHLLGGHDNLIGKGKDKTLMNDDTNSSSSTNSLISSGEPFK
jgi:rhodanese-related sulfurtransferase